jgi:hypothetical protein
MRQAIAENYRQATDIYVEVFKKALDDALR